MAFLRAIGLVCLAAAPAVAQTPPAQTPPAQTPTPDEEDDPAFSRQPPLPPPPEEEDPGFVEAPPPEADDGHGGLPTQPPPPRDDVGKRRRAAQPRGMKLRVGYRTFTLDENSMPGTMRSDRFHVVTLDAYPISESVRLGLVSQFGLEPSADDWFGTVGLALGIQKVGRVTPYGEVKAHSGLTRRSICLATPSQNGCQDHMTLLWGFGLEGGVDVKLSSGRTRGTVALGVERNQYFAAEAQDDMGNLAVVTDVTFTLKLGIGY